MRHTYLVALFSVGALTACGLPATPLSNGPQGDGGLHMKLSQFALNLPFLKEADFTSEYTGNKTVKLAGGKYENAGNKVQLQMTDQYAVGDLNGDSQMEAVVEVVAQTGGSGIFHNLVVYGEKDGKPVQLASRLLGDRVKVKSFATNGGVIQVDLITHGPKDPLCCPTQERRLAYRMKGVHLVEVKVSQ